MGLNLVSQAKANADAACSAGGMAAGDRGLGLTSKQMEANACARATQLAEACENMDDPTAHTAEGLPGMLSRCVAHAVSLTVCLPHLVFSLSRGLPHLVSHCVSRTAWRAASRCGRSTATRAT